MQKDLDYMEVNMACRNCYKYPLCEKCNSPKESCNEEKSKRIELDKILDKAEIKKQVNEMLE